MWQIRDSPATFCPNVFPLNDAYNPKRVINKFAYLIIGRNNRKATNIAVKTARAGQKSATFLGANPHGLA